MAKKGLKKNKSSSQKEEENSSMSSACEVDIAKEPHKLGSVLRQIVDQIDDAERSNTDTLQEMQARLDALSEQTSDAKTGETSIDKQELEKIENQIAGLSDRIEIISQGRAINADNLEGRIEALATKVSDTEKQEAEEAEQANTKNAPETSSGKGSLEADAPSLEADVLSNENQSHEFDQSYELEEGQSASKEQVHQKGASEQERANQAEGAENHAPKQTDESTNLQDEVEHTPVEEADITFAVTDQLGEDDNMSSTTLEVAEDFGLSISSLDRAELSQEHHKKATGKVGLSADHQIHATNYQSNGPIAPQRLASLAEHFSPVINKDTEELDDLVTPVSSQAGKEEEKQQFDVPKQSRNTDLADNNILEERFAIIASRLEETLALSNDRNQQERKEITSKFDDLAQKFDSWLSSSNDQKSSFNSIEQRIDSLTEYVQKAEAHAARIEVLEGQLMKLIDLVENKQPETMLQNDLGNAFEGIASRILEEKSGQIADLIASKVGQNFNQGMSEERLNEIQQSISAISAERQLTETNEGPAFSAVNETLMSMSGRLSNIEEQIRLEREYSEQELKKNSSLNSNKIEEPAQQEDETFHNELELSVSEVIEEGMPEAMRSQPTHPNDLEHQNDLLPPPLAEPAPLFEVSSEKPHFAPMEHNETNLNEDYVAAARRAAEAAYDHPQASTEHLSPHSEAEGVFDRIKDGRERLAEKGANLKKKVMSFGHPSASSFFVIGAIGLMLLCIGILFNELTSSRKQEPKLIAQNGTVYDRPYANILMEKVGSAHSTKQANKSNSQQTTSEKTEDNRILPTQPFTKQGLPKNDRIEKDKYATAQQNNRQKEETASLPSKTDQLYSGQSRHIHEISGSVKNLKPNNIPQTISPEYAEKAVSVEVQVEPKKAKKMQLYRVAQSPSMAEQLRRSKQLEYKGEKHEEANSTSRTGYIKQLTPRQANSNYQITLPPQQIGTLELRTAAASGNYKAQYIVAMRYAKGDKVQQNFAAAARWLRRSAAQSFPPAQFNLGNLYEKGLGVQKDIGKAKTWYLRAANRGNVNAMHDLAVLYSNYNPGSRNYKEAILWFRQAAGYGHPGSLYNLGVIYNNGMGIQADKKESYKWFSLAKKLGISHADEQLILLKSELTAQQIKYAEAEISRWSKRSPIRAANLTENEVLNYSGSRMSPFASSLVYNAQKMLNKLGYDVGPVDGQFGPKTRDAIKSFQLLNGLEATGVVTPKLISILNTQTVL